MQTKHQIIYIKYVEKTFRFCPLLSHQTKGKSYLNTKSAAC